MDEEIRIKHECSSRGGTGLYVGMAEGDGAAVVCVRCKGKGWRESVFRGFAGRKNKPGVRRVFEVNPGIGLGEGNGVKLSDFGGMPLADWLAGKPFGVGTENRAYTCPQWWAQCTGGSRSDWSECRSSLGRAFSRCEHFDDKAACWKRWDRERNGGSTS